MKAHLYYSTTYQLDQWLFVHFITNVVGSEVGAKLIYRIVLPVVCLWLAGCQPLSAPSGRLAYIGGDGNVYLTTATLKTKVALTVDATTLAEGNGRSYHRLAWSPDGWLAFAAVERGLDGTRSELYVAPPAAPARLVGQNGDHFVIYLYWSPQPCADAPTCRRLAYLIEGEQGIDLHLLEVRRTGVADRVLGAARPFYFTWSPDGEQMVWHQNGSRKHHPAANLTRYQVEDNRAEVLAHPPGYFLAPAWSPTGGSWLDVVETEEGVALRQVDLATQRVTTLVEATHDIAFVWSPDGKRVAYAVRGQADAPFFGPIHVVEVATGATQRLTDHNLNPQAFFWSPDSQRIAYIHWLALPNQSWAQWRVYNLISGQDRGFNAFSPSLPMRMLIGSFNQYAQSHRLWSPDARYLLYADRDRSLVERIWLVDTLAAKGAAPILVDEGALGVWSWE